MSLGMAHESEFVGNVAPLPVYPEGIPHLENTVHCGWPSVGRQR